VKQILFLIGFLLTTVFCGAATYDVGPGETYETFAAFHAAITVSPGDIIDGGNNTFTEKILPNGGGKSTARVTYQNIVVEGGGTVDYGIYIYSATNGDYHTYSNITVNATTEDGIQLANGCDNVILSNIIVSNISNRYGVIVQGNTVTIQNLEIHGTYNDGLVLLCGDDVEVNNVHIWDTDTSDVNLGDGLTVENSDATSQIHIQECEFEQWTDGKQGIIVDVSGTVEIENCLFWGKTGDEKGLRLSKSGTAEIHHNVFHDLNPAISAIGGLDANVSVYGNVFYNINDVAFNIWDGVFTICNNTVYSCIKCLHVNNAGAVTFKNNIIYGKTNYQAIEIYNSASYVGDNNCFYPASSTDLVSYKGSSYTTLAAYQAGETQDQNTLGSNPLFAASTNDDFRLRSRSPCISTGVDLGNDYKMVLDPRRNSPQIPKAPWLMSQYDFGKWDIGAYKYSPWNIVNDKIVSDIIGDIIVF
jgi:hypothetical protein